MGKLGTTRAVRGLLPTSPGVRYDVCTAAPQYSLGVAGDRLSKPKSPRRCSDGYLLERRGPDVIRAGRFTLCSVSLGVRAHRAESGDATLAR